MTGARTLTTKKRANRWDELRDENTPLAGVVDSFFAYRHDLAAATIQNYRNGIGAFTSWRETMESRAAVVGDLEPGVVSSFLADRTSSVSAHSSKLSWVALRSLASFLAEQRIHHNEGSSVLATVRPPKVKEEPRRALTDEEVKTLIQRSQDGEMAARDHAIVMTLLGCGLRRGELVGVRLGDIDIAERRLVVRAATSKSQRGREVTIPVETLKALDRYVNDYREGDESEDAALFLDRHGSAMTGNGVRKLFERLKVKTRIRDLCAHMNRHTWATNFHRAGSGSRFDLMTEGGWTTGRMVERYTKQRPFEERRRSPSPFAAVRGFNNAEKRPLEKRPSQQRYALYEVQPA